MFQIGKVTLVLLLAALVGCSHPLDAEGEGDIVSYTGTRDCPREQQPCENLVIHDYGEVYSGVPASGYVFVGWRNCDDQFPWCMFNVPAKTVKRFWGGVMPPLVAVFRSINLMLRNPPEGGVVSESGQHDCPAGQTCVVRGSETNGFGQVFTASPSEGYRFNGWRKRNGDYFCPGSTYPCEIEDEWASRIAQSDVLEAGLQGQIYLEHDRQLELVPTFEPLAPGSLAGSADRRIDTPGAYDRLPGVVAALPDGGYIVVWALSHSNETVGTSILARRYAEDGAVLGQEIQITTDNTTYQTNPHVVALPSNRFLVSWQNQGTDYQRSDIIARIFDIDGTPVSGEMNITAGGPDADLAHPFNVAKPGGGFLITWRGFGANYASTNGQHFDASGEPVGDPIRFGLEGDNYGKVTYFDDGASVTAWSRGYNGYYDNSGVTLQCVSPEGQLLQESTAGDYKQYVTSLAVLENNTFVVTWEANNRDYAPPYGSSESGVYARVFSRDCTALSDEILVNTYVFGDQTDSQSAAMNDGGFAVAWTSESHTSDNSPSVYVQRFNALGEKVGGEARINTYLPNSQSNVDIAALSNGDIAAVWSSYVPSEYDSHIYGKLLSFDSDGDLLPDNWEREYNLDPEFPYDALLDTDDDGEHNLDEFLNGGNPLVDEG